MKKLILVGITAAAFCCAPAYAAPPVFDWSGFYVGVEGGGGWKGMAGVRGIPNDAHLSGALGGVQIGNNWQNGNWVTGIKGDINISHIHGSVNWGGADYSANVGWFGTAEVQEGFLIAPTTKLYATGGLAFGHVDAKLVDIDTFRASRTMTGWTVGAGVEFGYYSAGFRADTPRPRTDNRPTVGNFGPPTLFLEYKYVNLGTSTFVLDDPERVHVRFNVVKVGANWKYGTQ